MKRTRRDLQDAITREWRWAQNRSDAHDELVAEALGVNRTDLRCLDILEQEGPLSAGRLAQLAGLTTGAMTGVVDRLERTGYVRRTRDDTDRRRVYVELTPLLHERAWPYYEPLAKMADDLYGRYTVAELELLLDFLETGGRLSDDALSHLRAR